MQRALSCWKLICHLNNSRHLFLSFALFLYYLLLFNLVLFAVAGVSKWPLQQELMPWIVRGLSSFIPSGTSCSICQLHFAAFPETFPKAIYFCSDLTFRYLSIIPFMARGFELQTCSKKVWIIFCVYNSCGGPVCVDILSLSLQSCGVGLRRNFHFCGKKKKKIAKGLAKWRKDFVCIFSCAINQSLHYLFPEIFKTGVYLVVTPVFFQWTRCDNVPRVLWLEPPCFQ